MYENIRVGLLIYRLCCNMNSWMQVEYPALGAHSKLLRVSSLKSLKYCTYYIHTVLFHVEIRFNKIFHKSLLVSYDRNVCLSQYLAL